MCFPNENLSGDNAHDQDDVMYIGFIGKDAVLGADDAAWNATNAKAFEESIQKKGTISLLDSVLGTSTKGGRFK